MKTKTTTVVMLAAALLAVVGAGCKSYEKGMDRGQELFVSCAQCHGAAGQGNEKFDAPPIAGLPVWYVERQLHGFKDGLRGTHFDDIEGMKMRPMARFLRDDLDIFPVSTYVASLPAQKPATTLEGGNAEAGKAMFATCAACHGMDAAGNRALGAPPLTGLADWYMMRTLKKFKAGVRGGAVGDAYGSQMMPMANTLVNEQAMKDVIAHIQTLAK